MHRISHTQIRWVIAKDHITLHTLYRFFRINSNCSIVISTESVRISTWVLDSFIAILWAIIDHRISKRGLFLCLWGDHWCLWVWGDHGGSRESLLVNILLFMIVNTLIEKSKVSLLADAHLVGLIKRVFWRRPYWVFRLLLGSLWLLLIVLGVSTVEIFLVKGLVYLTMLSVRIKHKYCYLKDNYGKYFINNL